MSESLPIAPAGVADHIARMRPGRFTGLVIRKKGVVRRGLRYGDDLVHDVLITGFSYRRLLERSIEAIPALCRDVPRLLRRAERLRSREPVTTEHVELALDAVLWSLHASLRRQGNPRSSRHWRPLCVRGRAVPGVVIYVGEASPERRGPVRGGLYLAGLRVNRKVLHGAPNGAPPPPLSKPESVARRVIEEELPLGSYARYALDPRRPFVLRLGGLAAIGVDRHGDVVRGEALDRLDARLRRLESCAPL